MVDMLQFVVMENILFTVLWDGDQLMVVLLTLFGTLMTHLLHALLLSENLLSALRFTKFPRILIIDLLYQADKIFAGYLLGVKSEGCISFYDWEQGKLVRRVDIDDDITDVVWSDNGQLLAIVTSSSTGEKSTAVTGAKTNDETYF